MSDLGTGLAGPEDRETCYRLAYEVFYEEMGTMGDIADHEARRLCDDVIERAHLLWARSNGRIVGSLGILLGTEGFPPMFEDCFDIERYAAIVPRSRMAINVRFLVRPEFRATGVPFSLITAAARFQNDHQVQLSFADCQPHLLNLYQALGFRPCAPAFDQPGFGVMIPLVLIGGDHDHLRAVESPLQAQFEASEIADDVLAAARGLLPTDSPAVGAAVLGDVSWADAYEILSRQDGSAGVFEGLSEQEVQQLLEASQIISCGRDQQIVLEDQGTRTVYVVLDGEVEVRVDDRPVARLGPGQPFGEIAFLLQARRTADVVARDDAVRVIALSERVLQRLIGSNSELAAKFLLNLSRTLALKVMGQGSTVRPGSP